jgi:hypothetical protein
MRWILADPEGNEAGVATWIGEVMSDLRRPGGRCAVLPGPGAACRIADVSGKGNHSR